MAYDVQKSATEVILELKQAVTARDVAGLSSTLAAAITTASSVRIKTERLEDIDTSVLQLLVSLRKSTRAFAVESPSEAFVTAVNRCGLRRELLAGSNEVV